MSKTVQAWHFLPEDRRLRYGGRDLVEAGKTYAAKGPLVLCRNGNGNGMHASMRAIDALRYARGPIVCRVELSGKILHGYDKLCARKRTVLWMADATMALHEFACREAELALERAREAGHEPDERSWKAIAIKRQWMAGQASDSELTAARSAALAAGWAAVRAGVRAGARTLAWDAAWTAAMDAARAARAAAWDAAMDAAMDAARAAAWDAARAAAWDAATGAAMDAANERLEAALMALEPKEIAG